MSREAWSSWKTARSTWTVPPSRQLIEVMEGRLSFTHHLRAELIPMRACTVSGSCASTTATYTSISTGTEWSWGATVNNASDGAEVLKKTTGGVGRGGTLCLRQSTGKKWRLRC